MHKIGLKIIYFWNWIKGARAQSRKCPPALSFYFWPKFVQCVECPHPHPQFRCKGQWKVPKSPIFQAGWLPSPLLTQPLCWSQFSSLFMWKHQNIQNKRLICYIKLFKNDTCLYKIFGTHNFLICKKSLCCWLYQLLCRNWPLDWLFSVKFISISVYINLKLDCWIME